MSSSFRRPKSEAALRLYSLPRRELQALCKQYGIPANKTNVAMADALSACVPADNAKPKASAGSSLGVAKTTDMKLKAEKKVGLPETALASFILTGKRKASPTKVAEQPTEVEDGGFPKLNTTPLKRGVKKPVQVVQEEKSKVTTVPAFTRALQDRIRKVTSAPAVSSPKPPVPTPRKRAAEAAAVVTRRGGDSLPPVSFNDLVSSPEKRQVHEIIELNSTAKTANKRRTRLAHKADQQEEESALPLSHAAGAENKVSKGRRVVFADEVEPPKTAPPEPEPQVEPESEPETETIEVSYAEIEFKDAAIHKELFGFQRNTTTDQEQVVAPLLKEDLENREDVLDCIKETEIEFRDRGLQQELFGAHIKEGSDPCEDLVGPTLDLQQAGTSASAVEVEAQERRSSDTATSYPVEPLIDSYNIPVQDHSVLSSICEDACEGSDRQEQALEEPIEQNLAQGSDPRPLPNDVSSDDLVENLCEKGSEVPDHSHPSSLECPSAEVQSDCGFTLEQEPSLISSSADAYVAIDDVRGLEDTEHQLENQEVVMVVDGNVQQHQSENQEVVMLVDANTEQHQSENHEVVMLVGGDTEEQSENHEVVMPVGDDLQEHQSENHEVVMLVNANTEQHPSENNDVVMLVGGDIEEKQSENHEVVMLVGDDIQEHQSENHEVVMLVNANTEQHPSENNDVVTLVGGDIEEKQSENHEVVMPVTDDLQEHQSENQEVIMLVDANTEQHPSENNDVVMLVGGDTEEKQSENHEVVMPVGDDIQEHQSENQEVVMLVDANTEQHPSENNDVIMLVGGDTEEKQSENHEVVMPVTDDLQEHQSENQEVTTVVDGDIKHHQSENHEVVMLVGVNTEEKQSENQEVVMPLGDDIQEHQSENHEVVMVIDGDIQHHQSENHEVVMVVDGEIKHHQSENHDIVDGLGDELLTEQCREETFLKAQLISLFESDEVQRSSHLDEKEKIETSRNVVSAKSFVAVGPELVMASPSSSSIPVTPATNAQDDSTKSLSGPANSNVSSTPVAVAQVHSAKRLSGPGTFNVPVTPVPMAQENSSKWMSVLRSANVPVTPAANAQGNSAKRPRSSDISSTPPTNAHHDSAKLFSAPSSASIPVTPVTKLRDNSESALAKAATPLTKIQSNIDSTLAKATSILEKLAAWRADAEKKIKEGYWDPKFSTGVESSSAPESERPLAKPVLAVNRDVPSAKKARPAPKSVLSSEKPLTVCEDTNIVSKGDMPSVQKMRTLDETKVPLEVSDKENQSDKSIDSEKSFRKMGGLGKDKKKGKRFEVLKDRSKNLPDHGTGLASIKERTGPIRPGDMSLRKLRAQVKQKVSQLETSKASPIRPQKAWNTSH